MISPDEKKVQMESKIEIACPHRFFSHMHTPTQMCKFSHMNNIQIFEDQNWFKNPDVLICNSICSNGQSYLQTVSRQLKSEPTQKIENHLHKECLGNTTDILHALLPEWN